MTAHRLVVVGASAGGVEALAAIAADLPDAFPAAVFVVLHLPEGATSFLSEILDRAGPLPAFVALDGATVEPGAIFVAPADHHLLLEPGRMRVLRGPRVNGSRPSVDVLFHSAARAYGSRTIGVVLSGNLSDGTLGLRAIKRRLGTAIVQADAAHDGMPASALANVDVDAVLPLTMIGPELAKLAAARERAITAGDDTVSDTPLEAGFDIAETREVPEEGPTAIRCPECGGALWELADGELQSYSCHVGHTYSADSLVSEQGDAVERAMWAAIRLLEERAELLTRLAERMETGGRKRSRESLEDRATRAEEQAKTIRQAMLRPNIPVNPPETIVESAG